MGDLADAVTDTRDLRTQVDSLRTQASANPLSIRSKDNENSELRDQLTKTEAAFHDARAAAAQHEGEMAQTREQVRSLEVRLRDIRAETINACIRNLSQLSLQPSGLVLPQRQSDAYRPRSGSDTHDYSGEIYHRILGDNCG